MRQKNVTASLQISCVSNTEAMFAKYDTGTDIHDVINQFCHTLCEGF